MSHYFLDTQYILSLPSAATSINYVADTFQALRNSEHRLRRAYICPLHTALLPQVINFVADFSFFLGCVLRNIRGDERRLRGADQRGVGGPART